MYNKLNKCVMEEYHNFTSLLIKTMLFKLERTGRSDRLNRESIGVLIRRGVLNRLILESVWTN